MCLDGVRKETLGCLPKLQDVCSTSTLIAVKAIRMRPDLIVTLLQQHPDLKVIHFVRDPRGIVLSRAGTRLLSAVSKLDLVEESRFLCERIMHDLSILDTLIQVFPSQIFKARYEDLATDPKSVIQQVYDYIGEDIPKAVSLWFDNSMSGSKNTGAYGTQRLNSTKTAYRWQDKLSEKDLTSINFHCSEVIKYYGYEL